ncbi:hypothetical protein PTSG_12855 [Salpingoeca rosetta]|uniref:Sulfotransferase domain-containing protein n=1 Tax=Salpingoeca rosetta (strain ATCC 50818 / BSB-021) TaxID=946362 RepID=F2UN56_SALR5|nr:uncharacterized protein PTSG_12855 [Salpingoeca rosetta]EGD78555.1 hypothetical protein PTSG_12855 [Salpingoeca rosetta]|eukprot:XP_004989504.1 hypothetical protein PTSG_12855 [Salpingoeca rosetta]
MMGAGFPTTIRLGPWRCKLVWVAVPIIVFIAVQLLTAFVIMSPQPAPTSSALAETATATAKATTGAAAAGAESPHIVQSSLDQRPVAVSSRKTRKDGTSSEVQQPGSRHAVKDASAAPAAPAAKPQLPPPSPSPPASPRAPAAAAAAEDTGGDAGKSSKNKKPGVEDDDFDDDDDGRMLQTSPLPVNVAAGRRCFDVNRTLPLDVSCFDDGRAPHGRPRCVCRDNSNTFSLLPSFFVIGAQKSGTTALMGLFLFHPKFVHMRAKEGHFFDRYEGAKPKHQKERARRWYRLMPRAPMDRSVFTGEGTPAYILTLPGIYTLKLMSSTALSLLYMDQCSAHVPNSARRETIDPTADTLLRRIAAAMDVRDASTRAALIAAINTCTPVQYVADDELHECLFTHMQDVPGFLAAVHSIKRNLGLFKCITTQLRREQQPVTVDSAGGQNVLRCFEHVPRETVPPPEMMFKLDMDCIDASMMLRTDVDIPPSSSCYDVAMALAQRVGQAGHGDGGGGGGGDDDNNNNNNNNNVDDFNGLMEVKTIKHKEYAVLPESCLRDPDNAPYLAFNPSLFWPRGSSSNIAFDFVYRGMYVDQLQVYDQMFGPNHVLIVASEDLQSKQNETFNAILRHIDVEPTDVSSISQDMIHDKISEVWPSFEETSGWRMHSETQHLNATLMHEVCRFFGLHNRRLALAYPQLEPHTRAWSDCSRFKTSW